MITSALYNRTIMITRPVRQTDNLCRLIEVSGGIPVLLPTIEISPVVNGVNKDTANHLLQNSDLVIFISSNAVQYLLQLLPAACAILKHKEIYAVGAATCNTLQLATLTHARFAEGTGSEALLNLPALQQECVQNKTVLIVRGRGGREFLKEQLVSYGARVLYLEVYQRRKPDYDQHIINNIWHNNRPDAIVISSAEGMQNLVELTATADREILFNIPLVVISERLATVARSLGFRAKPQIAAQASDDSALVALTRIFEVTHE